MAIVFGMIAVAAAAACSSDKPAAVPSSTSSSSTTVAPRTEDNVLTIGVLLPSSGPGASTVGQSARAAIDSAVSTANAHGGVLGNDVVVYIRDEGSDAASAAVGLRQLLDANIDVLIGPASSNTAIALVPTIVDAGVATCSPSASALALDDFPDDGLFFRTIPSDSLQAEAMASVIERTGDTTAAIAYIDDGYGRPFEQALQARLRARNIVVDASVGFSVDDDEYRTEAARLINSSTGAIALIGDAEAGSRMLAELAAASKTAPRDIVLNDALRTPWSLSLLGSVSMAARERIVGVSPEVLTANRELLAEIATADATGLFAGQAFDCATLFMLAAEKTNSSASADIAAAISDISSVGSTCSTFANCSELIGEGRSIDFGGADGLLTIGQDGDPVSARFEQFSFDTQGRDVTTQIITVTSNGAIVGS